MIQDLLIHTLHIRKKGQRDYFQVSIPRNAHRLIGIETGLFNKSATSIKETSSPNYRMPFRRSVLYGELRMQSPEVTNFFYASELVQDDANIGIEDFDNRDDRIGTFLPSTQASHGGRKEIDELDVCPTNIICGFYKDIIGERDNENYEYTVLVYLWFMAKENEQL
jgi:hypothetical protein